jgi:periplasmic protein CpxP/Spy
MSTQTKSKLYLLIIGILLITNIAMLFFFLDNKDKGKRPPNRGDGGKSAMMKQFLKDDVGFTDPQLQQYDTLSRRNRERMKADMDAMKSVKEQQFKELGSKGFSDSAIVAAAIKAADNQKQVEEKMLNYFVTIRKLCTPEQLPKFDSLFYKMWSKKKPPTEKK